MRKNRSGKGTLLLIRHRETYIGFIEIYIGDQMVSSQARNGVGVKLTMGFLETASLRFVKRKSYRPSAVAFKR